MIERGWLSDNAGRIENISLAPNVKNAIFPLFEAVMNSIHAIEERFGPDGLAQGNIEITLHGDEQGEYTGFTVKDNGVGFNVDNLTSLRRFDSRKKAKLGGKGVGRLLWLKVSEEAAIRSTFFGPTEQVMTSTFRFTVADPIMDYAEVPSVHKEIGTSVTINPFRSAFATRLPKKADTFANRLIAHFVSYFTNISHPQITIVDTTDPGSSPIDLFDIFSEKVERDSDFTFAVDGVDEPFTIHCFLLPKSISDDERSVNALYFGANGRAVTRHELEVVPPFWTDTNSGRRLGMMG